MKKKTLNYNIPVKIRVINMRITRVYSCSLFLISLGVIFLYVYSVMASSRRGIATNRR